MSIRIEQLELVQQELVYEVEVRVQPDGQVRPHCVKLDELIEQADRLSTRIEQLELVQQLLV